MARPGPWTPQRVYEMFPRLAERKANLGTQLSGGEQQMLAVGARAGAQPASCCCSTSRSKAWRRSSSRSCCASIARIVRDEGLSAIIVEQNPQPILPITHDAIVLDRGQIVHAAPSRSCSPIASSSIAGSRSRRHVTRPGSCAHERM